MNASRKTMREGSSAGEGYGVEIPVRNSSSEADWTALERRSVLRLTFYLGLSCPNVRFHDGKTGKNHL